MLKANKYDWKDSNLSLFGSETEKNVKKGAAEKEQAWVGAGQDVGLHIWRIVNFKVTNWPKDDYGKFYSGDSYIILNTYKNKDSDELLYDVHFWIGSRSTQDEYGTAAYKTVELDTLLDDKPVQHREVMDYESSLFKSYFPALTLLEGGAESGFKHVEPAKYTHRLLRFKKTGDSKAITVAEVPLVTGSLNSGDTFILDLGLEIYQFNGKECSKDEKFKAVQYLQTLKSDRSGKPKVESLDEREISSTHKFYSYLTEGPAEEPNDAGDDTDTEKKILRVSNETGSMETTQVSTGKMDRSMLDSNDVFIVDTLKEVFVWVGSKASSDEKKNGLPYAHNYLMKTMHPLIPVTVVKEGQTCHSFDSAFD